MKCIAIAIVIAAFLYSDAAYVAKYGSYYEGYETCLIIICALMLMLGLALLLEVHT